MGLLDRLRKQLRAERSISVALKKLTQDPYREPSHEEKVAKMATEFPFSFWQIQYAYENLDQNEAITRALLRLCVTTQMDVDATVPIIRALIREHGTRKVEDVASSGGFFSILN